STFDNALKYFSKDNFNLKNPVWNKVFLDPELGTLKTDKSLQRFAIQLILKHLNIGISMTRKDKVVFDNFEINHMKI
ncbi:MAG TPA: hypothetical protein VF455_11545, partial [Chryseobacterium sp.]